MLINNENLQGLRVTFSAAFNKAFETTTTNKDKVATTVPSSSKLIHTDGLETSLQEGMDRTKRGQEPV